MPGTQFEMTLAGLLARARLLERLAYDDGPWWAAAEGCHRWVLPLSRRETGSTAISLTGFLARECCQVRAAEIWCGTTMMVSWQIDPPQSSPLRIVYTVGIGDVERAA